MKIDWTKWGIELRRCGRVRCGPGWRLDWADPGWLADFDLWFVWAGTGEMRLADRSIPLQPGTCLWMRPGRPYVGRQNPEDRLGVTFLHFAFRDARNREIPASMIDLPPEVCEIEDFVFFDATLRRIVALSSEPEWRFEGETLFRGVLCGLENDAVVASTERLSPTDAENRRKVRQIAAGILEDCGTVPPLGELACRVGMSVSHFSRVFKVVLGESPQRFAVHARIDRARSLLHESSLTVGEIATALGYPDVYFFSRQFKQKTGSSPSDFRRRRISAAGVSDLG